MSTIVHSREMGSQNWVKLIHVVVEWPLLVAGHHNYLSFLQKYVFLPQTLSPKSKLLTQRNQHKRPLTQYSFMEFQGGTNIYLIGSIRLLIGIILQIAVKI